MSIRYVAVVKIIDIDLPDQTIRTCDCIVRTSIVRTHEHRGIGYLARGKARLYILFQGDNFLNQCDIVLLRRIVAPDGKDYVTRFSS